jgi:Fanconi anemia group M protein
VLKLQITIIFTKNYEDTAKFLNLMARKQKREISIRATKKARTKKEQLQFILEGFPGIGPKTAKKLLKKYKTLKAIINTPLSQLQEDIGKKADIFKILNDAY